MKSFNNCPWLYLALRPEPPGGAPQSYRQCLPLEIPKDTARGVEFVYFYSTRGSIFYLMIQDISRLKRIRCAYHVQMFRDTMLLLLKRAVVEINICLSGKLIISNIVHTVYSFIQKVLKCMTSVWLQLCINYTKSNTLLSNIIA